MMDGTDACNIIVMPKSVTIEKVLLLTRDVQILGDVN